MTFQFRNNRDAFPLRVSLPPLNRNTVLNRNPVLNRGLPPNQSLNRGRTLLPPLTRIAPQANRSIAPQAIVPNRSLPRAIVPNRSLIVPKANRRETVRDRTEASLNKDILTLGIRPRFRPNTPPTREEREETEGWLFSKANFVRTTYSRHYVRMWVGNVVSATTERYIPRLPESGIVGALKKLRSGILSKIDRFDPGVYKLSDDPETWGYLKDYIWYNILLGPYEWNRPRSGKQYVTAEDQFDMYDPSIDVPAEMTIEASTDPIGDATVSYAANEIVFYYPNYYKFTYEIPSEEKTVDYLRDKRKEFEYSDNEFMFILFHNLLVPYVFGKRPSS